MTTTARERPVRTDQQVDTPVSAGLLTKDELFKKRPMKTLTLEVPGYGPALFGELMGFERDELDNHAIKRVDDGKGGTRTYTDYRAYRARALVFSLRNPDGSKMFPDATMKDVELVNQLPVHAIDYMFDNGVDVLSKLTKKKQDEEGKGTSTTTGDGSTLSSD